MEDYVPLMYYLTDFKLSIAIGINHTNETVRSFYDFFNFESIEERLAFNEYLAENEPAKIFSSSDDLNAVFDKIKEIPDYLTVLSIIYTSNKSEVLFDFTKEKPRFDYSSPVNGRENKRFRELRCSIQNKITDMYQELDPYCE